ncbi:MAG: helix-turn-helix transcriptional regulator [Actinomycetota bacterium]|nr:helix-turn-helix transcriptional regulator [Actinomycetota bacterium]
MRCRRCKPVPEEIRRAADLLERRWLLQILYAAHGGAVRFNEFRQVLGDIPPRTLAARLSELEAAGVLRRDVIASRPPRVEYRLTDEGRRVKVIVDALRRWARPAGAARP